MEGAGQTTIEKSSVYTMSVETNWRDFVTAHGEAVRRFLLTHIDHNASLETNKHKAKTNGVF